MTEWLSLQQRTPSELVHLPKDGFAFEPIPRHPEQGCYVYAFGQKFEVVETETEIKLLVGITR